MSEIELHRKLLSDAPRNQAFYAALKAHITLGKTTVADLGAGTGFLSFLARQLGAAECTLIDYTDTLDLAIQLARANKVDGLQFIKAHSAELKRPAKVDLVVSETLGNYALEENLLETVIDARRYLKKGGAIIPCALKQFAAPVLHPRLQQDIDIWPDVGFGIDLTAARTVSLNNMYVRSITAADLGGDEQHAKCWDDLNLRPEANAPSSLRRTALHWSAKSLPTDATVYGWALWWQAELSPGIFLATTPSAPRTHWEQVYLPLLQPQTVVSGETIELSISSDTRSEVGLNVAWRTRRLQDGKALHTQDQDLLRGRI